MLEIVLPISAYFLYLYMHYTSIYVAIVICFQLVPLSVFKSRLSTKYGIHTAYVSVCGSCKVKTIYIFKWLRSIGSSTATTIPRLFWLKIGTLSA